MCLNLDRDGSRFLAWISDPEMVGWSGHDNIRYEITVLISFAGFQIGTLSFPAQNGSRQPGCAVSYRSQPVPSKFLVWILDPKMVGWPVHVLELWWQRSQSKRVRSLSEFKFVPCLNFRSQNGHHSDNTHQYKIIIIISLLLGSCPVMPKMCSSSSRVHA